MTPLTIKWYTNRWRFRSSGSTSVSSFEQLKRKLLDGRRPASVFLGKKRLKKINRKKITDDTIDVYLEGLKNYFE